jgi:radical SAM superfamily enzyme YgiQ (UPF0313 family)
LIVPPERKPDKNRFNRRELGQEGIFPPLGLAYIAAFLRQNNVDVRIIDSLALCLNQEEVCERAKEESPNFIGITVLTQQYTAAVNLSRALKDTMREVPIVFGGIHVSAEHEAIIEDEDSVDFCVRGEGEFTVLDLINTVENGGDLKTVKGITHRVKGQAVVNPPRDFMNNLDEIPFPARDMLPTKLYRGTIALEGGRPFSTILATRGCPFSCHYCALATMWKTQRRRSVENVLDEIEYLKKSYGIKYLEFIDDLLTVDKKWVIQLCRGMCERGLDDIQWECCGRIGLMDDELLQEMRRANCRCVSYGIEFGSQRMLDFVNKKITIPQVYDTVSRTNKAKIPIKGLFMMGYPTETKEEIQETLELARSLRLDYLAVSIVTPYPGTELHTYCKANGLLRINDWSNYDIVQLRYEAIELEHVTIEELLEYSIRINREFLLRPSYFFRMLWRHPRKALSFGPKLLARLLSA